MTPVQMKMARAAIGLTPEGLASKVGVSPSDIERFESGSGDDEGFAARVQAVFDEAGVVWVGQDGVRLASSPKDGTIPLGELNSANDE